MYAAIPTQSTFVIMKDADFDRMKTVAPDLNIGPFQMKYDPALSFWDGCAPVTIRVFRTAYGVVTTTPYTSVMCFPQSQAAQVQSLADQINTAAGWHVDVIHDGVTHVHQSGFFNPNHGHNE